MAKHASMMWMVLPDGWIRIEWSLLLINEAVDRVYLRFY